MFGPRLDRSINALLELANSQAPGSEARLAVFVLMMGADGVEHELPRLIAERGVSDSGVHRLLQAVEEVRRALSEARKTVRTQHVVSRVLLRQFLGPTSDGQGRQLINFHMAKKVWEPRSVDTVGYIPNFIRVDSRRTESIWEETENALGTTIQSVAGGHLADTEASIIRGAMALHIARHPDMRDIHDGLLPGVMGEAIDSFVQTPALWPLCWEALRRHKHVDIVTEDPALLREGAGYCYEDFQSLLRQGYTFRFGAESNYHHLKAIFSNLALEVLQVPRTRGDEFIVTDAGAQPVNLSEDRVGWSEGLGLATAEKIVLPLSPWLVATLDSRSAGQTANLTLASTDLVRQLNALQIRAARLRVFWRPGCLGRLPDRSKTAPLGSYPLAAFSPFGLTIRAALLAR